MPRTPKPLPVRLANSFCRYLARTLNASDLSALRTGQAVPADYCDANTVMVDAFRSVVRRSPVAQSPADSDLWNMAYSIAAIQHYQPKDGRHAP